MSGMIGIGRSYSSGAMQGAIATDQNTYAQARAREAEQLRRKAIREAEQEKKQQSTLGLAGAIVGAVIGGYFGSPTAGAAIGGSVGNYAAGIF